MSAYEVGDRVRVTHEGVVTGEDVVARRIFLNGGESGFGGASLPVRYADVTVLERRKPKVGDVIDSKAFDSLPTGTNITGPNEQGAGYPGYSKVGNGKWVSLTYGGQHSPSAFEGDYIINYIPGA